MFGESMAHRCSILLSLVHSKLVAGSIETFTVFVARPTKRMSAAQNLFLESVRAQGHTPDTPNGSKNASGPVCIPLKKGTSGTRR